MSAAKPGYTIDYDAIRRILKLILVGLWDHATVEAYERDLRAETAKFSVGGKVPADIAVLVDVRDLAIQPQGVAADFQRLIESVGFTDSRSAIINSASAIQKAQNRRISAKFSQTGYFEEEGEAMAWLAARPKP